MTTDTTTAEQAYKGIIAEYSPADAAIAELRERYAGVIFPVDTKKGMEDAKDVRRKLVKLRTGLEALRKEIKEPALRRTQAIDAEAKAITAAIKAIEEPIDAQIKAEEQRIEDEKAAKAAREAEIKGKIAGIRGLAQELALAEVGSADIAAEREALAAFVPTEEVFGEFLDDCKAALTEADAALAELFEKVSTREQAAAAVIAEQAKLEAERRAFEEERAAYEAEKRAFEERKAAEAAASSVEQSGSVSEPTATPEELEKMQKARNERFAAQEAELATQEPELATEQVTVAPFHIRQLALATADQFQALAGKVAVVGFIDFSHILKSTADSILSGQFDKMLMEADHAAIIAADNALIDATMNAIDALGEGSLAA